MQITAETAGICCIGITGIGPELLSYFFFFLVLIES